MTAQLCHVNVSAVTVYAEISVSGKVPNGSRKVSYYTLHDLKVIYLVLVPPKQKAV